MLDVVPSSFQTIYTRIVLFVRSSFNKTISVIGLLNSSNVILELSSIGCSPSATE